MLIVHNAAEQALCSDTTLAQTQLVRASKQRHGKHNHVAAGTAAAAFAAAGDQRAPNTGEQQAPLLLPLLLWCSANQWLPPVPQMLSILSCRWCRISLCCPARSLYLSTARHSTAHNGDGRRRVKQPPQTEPCWLRCTMSPGLRHCPRFCHRSCSALSTEPGRHNQHKQPQQRLCPSKLGQHPGPLTCLASCQGTPSPPA